MTARHPLNPDPVRRSLVAGLGMLPAMPLLASTPVPQGPQAPGALTTGVFRHPGLLISEPDFARIREHIRLGEQPWTQWWDKLCIDGAVRLDVMPNPQTEVYRADNSKHAMYRDIQRAWCLALRWKLSDDIRYADKAVETLDAWANTLKVVGTVRPGSTAHDDHTFILMAGMQGHQWAQVGEIMRAYSGWRPENQARFKEMLLNVFVKISSDWLTNMTDKGWGLHSHANWHLASMVGTMAIGVFCDRHDLYRQACDYYAANNRGERKMFGNGSIVHGVYFMHPGHMGQWQESGRDQGHSTLGISLGGDLLEVAWNQGDDLYGLYNNRFLAAAEYVARSNLKDGNGNVYPMPFSPQDDASRPHANIWTQVNQSFQHGRNAWEPIYNHYVNRMGLAAPNVARMVPLCEPNYWSWGSDDICFPTLIHRRPTYPGPMKPASGLTAHVRDGRAVLSWWGSVGAASYEVRRGSGARGPFSPLATLSAGELLTYTDTPPNGVWFYQVTAVGSSGARADSNVARAAVPGEPRFSMPLNGRNNTDIYAAHRSPSGDWSVSAGKLINGATWGEGRLNDKAIVFDGLASAEGNTAGVKLPPGIFADLDDFTVSMWAYANALRWDSALFYAGHDGFSGMGISPMAGRGMRFGIMAAGGGDCQFVETSGFMPIRRWVHVAFTLRGTTGRIYVDGKEAASSDGIFLSPRQVGDQVAFIGRNWGHPSFNGRIQDFRVYAGALSAAEVAALAV